MDDVSSSNTSPGGCDDVGVRRACGECNMSDTSVRADAKVGILRAQIRPYTRDELMQPNQSCRVGSSTTRP